MSNPFSNPTKEELKKREEENKALGQKVKNVAELARTCLASTDFAKYKEVVKEARESMISLMKANNDPDYMKFAFFCKACLSKIDAWDMIIDLIEKDAKKDRK